MLIYFFMRQMDSEKLTLKIQQFKITIPQENIKKSRKGIRQSVQVALCTIENFQDIKRAKKANLIKEDCALWEPFKIFDDLVMPSSKSKSYTLHFQFTFDSKYNAQVQVQVETKISQNIIKKVEGQNQPFKNAQIQFLTAWKVQKAQQKAKEQNNIGETPSKIPKEQINLIKKDNQNRKRQEEQGGFFSFFGCFGTKKQKQSLKNKLMKQEQRKFRIDKVYTYKLNQINQVNLKDNDSKRLINEVSFFTTKSKIEELYS